ncbi:hypothetical protein Pfo_026520 [Paulownia fortunei]|nr:hypothetical protein Pfo_026520 [Paulownia fortunei]
MSESLHNHPKSMLHTEPSFSIYSTDDKFGEEAENEDLIKEKLMENQGKLERSAAIGESIETQFSFGANAMRMIKEDDDEDDEVDEEDDEKERASNRFKDLKVESEYTSPPATGAGGLEAEIGGDGVEFGPSNSGHDGDLDKYYNEMVRKDPSNPLILRNYARYLESKRDFSGAEEYYFRATLADPKDGEVLSQYAKLVWELHGDQARASNYFERAARAAPEDSNVLAAYASFLWNIDESEEEERLSNTQIDEDSALVDLSATDIKEETRPSSPPLHLAMGLGINVAGFGGCNNAVDYISKHSDESTTAEEYYRRMVEENPCNPLFLRNYAHFLHQSKGDLQGAEEYYSRAILEDPGDGHILSLYASIVWQLHRDKDKAAAYFERAVQATPADSTVLAAYAKFLWETEAEDDVTDEAQGEAMCF